MQCSIMPPDPSGAFWDLAILCFINVHNLWTFRTVFPNHGPCSGVHSPFFACDHLINNLSSFSHTTVPKLTSLYPQYLHGCLFLYWEKYYLPITHGLNKKLIKLISLSKLYVAYSNSLHFFIMLNFYHDKIPQKFITEMCILMISV